MHLDVTLSNGYQALKPLGVPTPNPEAIGNLASNKIIPWSYYILASSSAIFGIISIAAYALKQTSLVPASVSTTLLLAFGAYEIKRLSLTEAEATQVQSYRKLINIFIDQVKLFASEKENLDTSINTLKTQNNKLLLENQKIEKLTATINATGEDAKKQIAEVKEEVEKIKTINTELQNEIQLLNKAKSDLLIINNSQKEISEQFENENKKLTTNIENLKNERSDLKTNLEQQSDLNKDLNVEVGNLKNANKELSSNILKIADQNKELESNYNKLNQADEKLKKDIQDRALIEKRLEETTAKLERKVQKLSDLKQLKLDYDKKLGDEVNALTLENEQLKKRLEDNEGQLKHADHKLLPKVLHNQNK